MPVHQMISSITFKTLISVALCATLIISVFYLSQDLHAYLGKFENGDVFQMVAFGFLAIASTAGLFLVLAKRKKNACRTDLSIETLLTTDFKILGLKFVEGFIIGLTTDKETIKERKQN